MVELKRSDLQRLNEIFSDWYNAFQEEIREAEEQGLSTELIPDMERNCSEDENILVYIYRTCSKKGTWKLIIDFKLNLGYISFNGYRNSFLGGNQFIEVVDVPLYPELNDKITFAMIDTEGNEITVKGRIVEYKTSKPEKPLGFSQKLWSAVRKFSQKHPRLFKANDKFFRYVLEHDKEIEEKVIECFKEHPKRYTYLIVTKNKLSKWSDIVIKINKKTPVEIFKAYRYTATYSPEQTLFIDQDKIKIENETTILIL